MLDAWRRKTRARAPGHIKKIPVCEFTNPLIIIIIVPDVTGVTEKEKTHISSPKWRRKKKYNKTLIDLGYDERRDRAHTARPR